jgi:hypothetical protein
MEMPSDAKSLMTSPLITLPAPPPTIFNLSANPALIPSNSTFRTAFVPLARVLGLDLGWV